MKKILIPGLIAAVVLAAIGIWYFVIRDDELNVSAQNIDTSQTTKSITQQDTPDGQWTIQQQRDVFVGYEIEELFGGETAKKTAVGRSREVTGSFTINNGTLIDTEIDVDLTALTSDNSRRDSKMTQQGLETNDFPTARFTQTKPVTTNSATTQNVPFDLSVPGTLTLHGVEQPITVDLTALWNGKVITVSGAIDINLADYKIEPPDSPFVSVDDAGTIKLQLLFVPQS